MVVYPWFYILYVPLSSLVVANSVAPNLNNPDGVETTFPPVYDAQENLIGYIADFLATEDSTPPSKALLENALNGASALADVKWWRMDNPWKPGNSGSILRAKHQNAAGIIGELWSFEQALETLGYGG